MAFRFQQKRKKLSSSRPTNEKRPWWAACANPLFCCVVSACAYAIIVILHQSGNVDVASRVVGSNRNSISPLSLKWNSENSVVMGLAAGYGLDVYQRFVGSLRATGFRGHIILGIAPNPTPDVAAYLARHNVTTKTVDLAPCTFLDFTMENGQPLRKQKCAAAYPDYKIQWGRFPLARDWLRACDACTGGVMLTDVRDVYFQADPFAAVVARPLLVFEEIYPELTTEHWLAHHTVARCRRTQLLNNASLPMLCSGSTMGSKGGIIRYVEAMVREFEYWNSLDQCRSDMVGDDQSIHNYLYYSHQLEEATAVPHRTGPIHVVGVQADTLFRRAIVDAQKDMPEVFKDKFEAETWVNNNGFRVGSNKDRTLDTGSKDAWQDWLGKPDGAGDLVDPVTGFVLNLDGRPSPQVHQFDRFGRYLNKYLNRMVKKEWSHEN